MHDTFFSRSETSDKTDKSDIQRNEEFLATLFCDGLMDIRPVIVAFAGNPQTVPKSAWFGKAWSLEETIKSDQNTFFSLAAFRPDDAGKYRRKKKHFHALYAIMLDDVGTKVPHDRITLPPSWMIETSSGNYQAGYILAEPLEDAALADRLMKAIIAAQLCDPGAGGPTARLARLPFGVNGKHNPSFSCHLETWRPDLRYSVDDLVTGLELDMRAPGRAEGKMAKSPVRSIDYEDDIFVPRPQENAVIAAIKSKGLYKAPLGSGKHDITCPWVHEHTDCVDDGTAYFEPDDTYPIGGFKCLHGHCAERHVQSLLDHLGLEACAARMKPKIRCVSGEIHRVVDKAEHELAQAGKHFQRGGLIVTITTDPGIKETCVKDVRKNALVSALSSVAEWERYDKRSESWGRIDPPSRMVSVLCDATDYRHLPVLNGLAHQPYLRSDGSLSIQSGYDSATGMFGVFTDDAFNVREIPTREDAQAALALIKDLLSEFAFTDEVDRAAALSAILTATIRPSLSLAPMYHARAPQISSGKTFLCQIIGLFASPRRNAPTSFPQDDEECRKLLLSELLRAPAVIEFDNMTTDIIAHKSLCTSLTSEFLTGRILGVSKTATVSTRTLFLSSGNNVGPIHDMTRRCITINLDPACESPASRIYKNPHLLRHLGKERERYVTAALTIIRAWVVAGQPKLPCKALASYEEWSDLCRQPLLWLGLPDPTENLFKIMSEDPDREILGRLLQAWKQHFGHTPRMVRDAVKAAHKEPDAQLHEVMSDIAEDQNGINRKILGHWIKRHAHQIVDGMRFVPDTGRRSAAAWRVETVSSDKSV